MKAAQYNSYGGPEVITINPNVPIPQVADNQVLVEVHAASLNPIDFKVRAGYLKEYVPLQFPVTIGGNFSGVVTQIGNAVTKFSVGDAVYGQSLILNGGSGSIAEFLVSNEDNTALKPKKINNLEAAALPLVGVSALQAIEKHINLMSGQKILIHGGAGGIGSIAIQIAKSKGAYVATTVAGKDKKFVSDLGADEAFDYKGEDFSEKLHEYDAVFDTSGVSDERTFKILKKGGIIVSMTGSPDADLAQKYGVVVMGQNTNSNRENLEKLTELVEGDHIKVIIDKVFSIDETKAAFEYLETQHPKGKVVIQIK